MHLGSEFSPNFFLENFLRESHDSKWGADLEICHFISGKKIQRVA